MAIALDVLTTFRANLRAPMSVGAGPYGNRVFYEAADGTVTGPRLTGTISSGGGDWLLLGPDGFAHLDVRFIITTGDGAVIYVYYPGVLELNDKVQATLSGTEDGEYGEYGDSYYFTTPRFETGDPRYAWLSNVVAIAQGRVHPSAVEFTIYTARHS